MNTAIIVAAGSGTRFNSERPKQFLQISGKPLIVHTLDRFESCAVMDTVILVLAAAEIEPFYKIRDEFGLTKLDKIVAGGNNRAQSVFNGLEAVDPATSFVVVHDGARPLVSVDEITRIVEMAEKTGAACLVAPVTDTIKEIDGERITGTLDREKLRRALTPQAFRLEILQSSFAQANLNESVTDECYLVEKLGHPITIVEGSLKNIKITTEEDLVLAEAFLQKLR